VDGQEDMVILYIDDDAEDLEIFQAAISLIAPACQYFQASDGNEGLRKLKSITPDYIFLDVNMPRMNGLEVLEAIRADKDLRRSRVIMFSTTILDGDAHLYRAKGAHKSITKPNSFKQLCEILQSIFSHKEIC
jgi:CheY-like chemotaxis protein